MKKGLLLPLLLFLFTVPGLTQEKVGKRAVREATEESVARYRLSANQAAQMEVIQAQRLTNLASIDALRGEDYAAYLARKGAIRHYVEEATRKLLTPRQLPILEAELRERQAERERLLSRLKEEGASRQARERALLELEENWR